MKKNRLYIYLSVFLLVLAVGCKKETVKVASNTLLRGNWGTVGNDTLYLYSDDVVYHRLDTIIAENGKFSWTIPGEEEFIAYLSYRNREYPIFISKGDTLSVDYKDSLLHIGGSDEHTRYDMIVDQLIENNDSINVLVSYIEQNPFYLHSYYLFNRYFVDAKEIDSQRSKGVLEKLPGVIQDKYYLEKLSDRIIKKGRAKEGNSALYFNLKDIKDHKSVDLQQTKNKVVVLSFWASWDSLSVQNNKQLLSVYNKLKGNKDFMMLGIALDSDTIQLKENLKNTKYKWQQLYETNGLQSTVADRYGIMQLPTYIVLKKDNTITLRTNSIDSLENKILKIYNDEKKIK